MNTEGPPAASDPVRATASAARVLIMSNYEERRAWLAAELSAPDLHVESVVAAADSLTTLPPGRFNLVVVDAAASPPGGVTVLHRLAAAEQLAGVPVLTVAWPDAPADVEAYLEMGAVEYLLQEAGGGQLRTRVVRWLDYQRLRHEAEEYRVRLITEQQRSDRLVNVVIPIGMALSAEKNFDRLLEMILLEAKQFCNADGGTLYLRTDADELAFMIMRNDSLAVALGGTSGKPVQYAPIPLFADDGLPNERNVASYAALRGESINIHDAYTEAGFDFSGTREFDKGTGYRSKSFLTIPLKNTRGYVIGVLQLLNAIDTATGEVVAFDHAVQRMAEILAALATIALEAYIREQKLRDQIQQLSIEIDEFRKDREVAEITESDYFQRLRERARAMRSKSGAARSEEGTG